MKIKRNMQFWEEDGNPFGSVESQGGGYDGGSSDPSPTPTPSPSPSLDPKAFAKEFGSVIADQFKQRDQQQQQAPKTYTPEEIAEARKKLKFWEPGDEFVTKFGNLETQKAAFIELRDGLMDQFVEIQKALLQQQEEKWNGKFQPVQTLLEQRNQQEQLGRFHSAYPVLASPKLKTVIDAVGSELAQAGAFQNKSESEAFEILALAVEAKGKEFNPDFSVGARNMGNNPPGRRSNAISPSASGSGGGGSGGGNGGGDDGGPKAPKAASLFAKIRG